MLPSEPKAARLQDHKDKAFKQSVAQRAHGSKALTAARQATAARRSDMCGRRGHWEGVLHIGYRYIGIHRYIGI